MNIASMKKLQVFFIKLQFYTLYKFISILHFIYSMHIALNSQVTN